MYDVDVNTKIQTAHMWKDSNTNDTIVTLTNDMHVQVQCTCLEYITRGGSGTLQ